jgi:uncharacterized lipoprotein NlpE involved in copper resistance
MHHISIYNNQKKLEQICSNFSSLGTFTGVNTTRNNAAGETSYRARWESNILVGLGVLAIQQISEEAAKEGFSSNSVFCNYDTEFNKVILEISFFKI